MGIGSVYNSDMRYFIHLAYDGGNYRGWQRQEVNPATVQEVIEHKLSKIFKKKMYVHGCGRTDAGVHSSQYVIHINVDEAPKFDLKFLLNKNLPHDIVVFDVIEVEDDQHCQYDAVARTYDYFIHWKKDPSLYHYSSFYEIQDLDFDMMRQAASLILKTNDFKALCKQPDLYPNTLCFITNCEVFVNEELGRLRFSITSNRFLRGMIRYCVFFLLEVGCGAMTLEDFALILNQEKVFVDKLPAFPNGLFLSKIEYPYLKLQDSHLLIKAMKAGLE